MKAEKKPGKRRKFSWVVTLLMVMVIFIQVSLIWALFVSGPVRIEEKTLSDAQNKIKEEVPDIEGLRRNVFDYVTWQGYTADTLYWFDATGANLTTREMSTLNYEGARQTASEKYGVEDATVELAFGYTTPVYTLENDSVILMLDYDTLDWVYERVKVND